MRIRRKPPARADFAFRDRIGPCSRSSSTQLKSSFCQLHAGYGAIARFSLENCIQTDLAWGLALLSIGKRREGEDRLEWFCANFDVKRDMPTLVKAEAEAKPLAEH
ncbi:hypothetical protein C7I55_25915 [Sphingomonas deserti]|uniref:Uncharacterized protein n=1 Tax=Allosphingosinicella deserti TaxID=2116704 RepID=A0A2P7QEW2_9SPHN|nr:hypothetical protein C7I55_25915 [Sphingomonas deserti]